MPTLRIEKNRNYTVMSNFHLRDKRLKLKTIGLLSIMLSLPDNWDFSANGLVQICGDGRTAVNAAIHQLEVFGYLTRNYTRDENGQWADIEYIVREIPLEEVPITENRISDNQTQINTDLNKYGIAASSAREENRKSTSGEDQESTSQPLTEGERNLSPSCAAPPLRDPDYAEVSAEYQRNFALQPMGVVSDIISDCISKSCKEAVIYAIHEAKAAMPKKPYRYMEKVVHSMIASGVTDAAGVEAYKARHQAAGGQTPRRQSKMDIFAEVAARFEKEDGHV